MWTCPSCGAPQAETARCWVCRRSSTTCSTCTHFRRALAGDLGYCGKDARRLPLTGLELRGCWEPKPDAADVTVLSTVLNEAQRRRASRAPVPAYRAGEEPPSRGFVPVGGDPSDAAKQPAATDDAPPAFVIEPEERWADRTSLFGDAEG